MNEEDESQEALESLIARFEGRDGMDRQKARESVVALGPRATPLLMKALSDSRQKQVRWEAAKALGAIADPRSIKSLVRALEDRDPDVAWLAARALRKFKKAAWPDLLLALMKDNSNSRLLRLGARQVFAKQEEPGYEDLLAALREDLEDGAAAESSAATSYMILSRMESEPRGP